MVLDCGMKNSVWWRMTWLSVIESRLFEVALYVSSVGQYCVHVFYGPVQYTALCFIQYNVHVFYGPVLSTAFYGSIGQYYILYMSDTVYPCTVQSLLYCTSVSYSGSVLASQQY